MDTYSYVKTYMKAHADPLVHPMLKYKGVILVVCFVFIGLVVLGGLHLNRLYEGLDNVSPSSDKDIGKMSACGTDCGKYIETQKTAMQLQRMVSEFNGQTATLEDHGVRLKKLGDEMKNQGANLAPSNVNFTL
jgi:hypothetical protein